MPQELDDLQQRLGHRFADVGLLQLALTHRSASKTHNERHEFLGDALLGFLVANKLFHDQPQASEGELTRSRAALVNKPALARLARYWKLGDLLRLGSGERKSGGGERDSILADAVEAVVAAVYLDGGLESCERCLPDWLEVLRKNESLAAISGKDPKTSLQEWLQARGEQLPHYEVEQVSGPAHEQSFSVSCSIRSGAGQTQSWQGQGASKREAEQRAAASALRDLGEQSSRASQHD